MTASKVISTAMTEPGIMSPRRPISKRIWLADLTYTQQTIAADVMPNAIGGIATFTETRVELPEPIRLFKYPEKLAEALERDGIPDVIGFSNYIWNFDLSIQFATVIKRHSPDTVIIFGGPNYPIMAAEQKAFLEKHGIIDFHIVKEGELAFSNVLIALDETAFNVEAVKQRGLASVHSIGKDGRVWITETVERIRDLADIPSPYTSGRLDEFFDGMLLPIIQTNRGCPFSCTFCVEGVRYYNKIYRNSAEKVTAELDHIGRSMAMLRAKGGRNDLFIADSNFGMYKEDLDTCREIARTRETYGWPEYINVATGKNQKERVLAASRLIDGALRLSGSVQSLDLGVLENIKRSNIEPTELLDLALRAAEIGANSYSEIILGLPGDSTEAHFRTVRLIMDAGFTNIYLFQLMLLPGTELSTEETKAKYGMVRRYRVLPRCYGQYQVLFERVIAAEIEEICVANNTLSFSDYLECRRFHLLITIFHNDGVFGVLLRLLRMLKVSVFRWMELMREAEPPRRLGELFSAFERATREELWDDRESLARFLRQPGIIERCISGELGNNLLFVHKTLAMTGHVDELVHMARSTIRAVLTENHQASEDVVAFVDDALTYHRMRMTNIFENSDQPLEAVLHYDIKAFEGDPVPSDIEDYAFDVPQRFKFAMDDSQRELINRYIGIYGNTPVGLGRIISKIYVKKLFRHAIRGEAVSTGQSEFQYRIAGLQN